MHEQIRARHKTKVLLKAGSGVGASMALAKQHSVLQSSSNTIDTYYTALMSKKLCLIYHRQSIPARRQLHNHAEHQGSPQLFMVQQLDFVTAIRLGSSWVQVCSHHAQQERIQVALQHIRCTIV